MTLSDLEKKDSALAGQAQSGNREAFSELVERFQGRIFSFTYNFFRNRELAEELTQETFLRAFQYIKKYDRSKKFSTWLYSIAKNICIDEKRKIDRSRSVSIDDVSPSSYKSDDPGQHHRDPSEISLQLEERILLEEAVSRLPEKYRTAIILCYFQELSYQEVADILGLSLNLVKVRIFRAKKQLLEILKEKQEPASN